VPGSVRSGHGPWVATASHPAIGGPMFEHHEIAAYENLIIGARAT
jgi:hypothetical protein